MQFKYLLIAALVGIIDINALRLTTSWDGNAPMYANAGAPIDPSQVENFANNDAAHTADKHARREKYAAIDAERAKIG